MVAPTRKRWRALRPWARRGTLSLAGLAVSSFAVAAQCGPDVLGTSRTLVLKREAAAYGTAQHPPLPLEPGEVVITFDDGPRPESTPAVLDALRRQCVQATFFMLGEALLQHRPGQAGAGRGPLGGPARLQA